MSDALGRAVHHASAWLDNLDEQPVGPTASLENLRARFDAPLPQTGAAPEDIIDDLVEGTEGGLQGVAGGRFFAWVKGSAVEAALAADWLAAAWDQNPAIYACAPAISVIEERAGEWLKDLLDLPREASFAFTTGCQLAHMTGLAAARHRVLADHQWDVEKDGLFGAPPIRVLTTRNYHESVERALRFLGVGKGAIEFLETDDWGRMLPEALEAALADRNAPTIVSLCAADLNVGMCDDFATLIPIAKAAGAWVHVDGAFGLFARASRDKRKFVEGVELADSWATDAHKWLNVPYDCGISFVRDREAHKASMTIAASYLADSIGGREGIDWNPEWSRRARAVPVYAALREMGREGVEAMVDRCCRHCTSIVEGIGALDGAEALNAPTLNQGLVRFSRIGASDEENNNYTDEIISAINETGEGFFSGTNWKGRRAMRVSVVSWRTSQKDVARVVEAARQVLKGKR